MEEERIDQIPQDGEPYQPRPLWQVWLARLGLLAFLIFVALFYFGLFGGGA